MIEHVPQGSVSVPELLHFGDYYIRDVQDLAYPFKPEMPAKWNALVAGKLYPELWLRYYGALRHAVACMVICSDYANNMTGQLLPIVRHAELDRQLLLAHAQLLHWIKRKAESRKQKAEMKKGQKHERRTKSNRNRRNETLAGVAGSDPGLR